MSPGEKRRLMLASAVFLAVAAIGLALYLVPVFFCVSLVGIACVAYYHRRGKATSARLGRNRRRGRASPTALGRWLSGLSANGVAPSASLQVRADRADVRCSEVCSRRGPFQNSGASDTALFSPRDILMGSYISKEEPAIAGRPRVGAGANPRELLRERLSRPNHAADVPNRRLSFAGEPPGTTGRFNITPQRHYPLQQSGTASVGLLPPTQLYGFRKKNVLTLRNFPTVHSPVTVKIARPDHSTPRPPLWEHSGSPGGLGSPSSNPRFDPCSRESVLKALKESHKRNVVKDDDGSFTAEQHSKRRRNDSGGSAHSAFEPLLPNGVSSHLVPKPGSLKRLMNSVAEDSTTKRSRTSSISSGSGPSPFCGTSGSARNPINSSYSSSRGIGKWKASEQSSPLSTPGSSRAASPERATKKAREDYVQSPTSTSSGMSNQMAANTSAFTSKLTPAPKVHRVVTSDSVESGGKRKRKIQLVSNNREDQIYLPPPPEIGYTVTGKDLDQEKKAALRKIQKVLEPDPEKAAPSAAATHPSSQSTSTFDSTTTLSSLLAAPLPVTTSTPSSVARPVPVINLQQHTLVTSAGAQSSPAAAATLNASTLLEALKTKSSANAGSAPAAPTTTTTAAFASVPPADPGAPTLKPLSTMISSQLSQAPSSQSSSTLLGQPLGTMASAFSQVQGQTTKAATSALSLAGTNLFGQTSQLSSPVATSNSKPLAPSTGFPAVGTGPGSSSNPLLASGFKPIFVATTSATATSAQESKPAVPTFNPIFGSATASAGLAISQSVTTAVPSAPTMTSTSTASMFGGLTNSNTAVPSLFTGLANMTSPSAAMTSSTTTTQAVAPPAVKSLFGSWAPPATTNSTLASAPISTAGGPFQFGSTATISTPAPTASTSVFPTTNTFTFGNMPATTQPVPQASTQNIFAFGQAAAGQNPPAASFGGFPLANASTTTAATVTAAAPVPQPIFSFGKPVFEAQSAPPPYPTSAATPAKPFTFGSAAAAPAPTSAPAPAPFPFGSAATTAASTFGTPSKPAFGASSASFAFGGTTAAAVVPSFGPVTQTQTAPTTTFAFGSSAPQQTPAVPAQPASGGFNFGAAVSGSQFGMPISNNPAAPVAGFNFGTAATDKPAFGTPTFGQSAAAGPTPFGSPATPVQGFSSVTSTPFGAAPMPSFSIGAGSKPSGARQRLQARRQHTRKK